MVDFSNLKANAMAGVAWYVETGGAASDEMLAGAIAERSPPLILATLAYSLLR